MESLDAELAARLQAEENGRARSTRGGSGATSATVRKRGTPTGKKGEHGSAKKKKRVSKATLDSADDSELDGTGSEVGAKKKITTERKGGFHKPMVLSQTLSEFFGGEEKVCPYFLFYPLFADVYTVFLRGLGVFSSLIMRMNSYRGRNALSAYGLISKNTIFKTRKTGDRFGATISCDGYLSRIV
jgi:hypothetical protein